MKKALLLGAGFSYDLGMPLAKDITNILLNIFDKENTNYLIDTYHKNDGYGDGTFPDKNVLTDIFNYILDIKKEFNNPKKKNNSINYEDIIKHIESLDKKYGTQADKSKRLATQNILSLLYSLVHDILSFYQVQTHSSIYKDNLKNFSKLKNILSEKETWVFTLNHDLYFESLCIDLNIPISYGDCKTINFPVSNKNMTDIVKMSYETRESLLYNQRFINNEFGVNLLKLHGGISELEYKDNKIICNQELTKNTSKELIDDFIKINSFSHIIDNKIVPSSGSNTVITNINGDLDIICKSMLTGGNKYKNFIDAVKGEEKVTLFSNKLEKIDNLTIIGYSFCDNHINTKILNAMVKNPNMTINIISPSAKVPVFLEQFTFNTNRRVNCALCGAAEWINYIKNEKWDRNQLDSLENNRKKLHILHEIILKHFKLKYSIKQSLRGNLMNRFISFFKYYKNKSIFSFAFLLIYILINILGFSAYIAITTLMAFISAPIFLIFALICIWFIPLKKIKAYFDKYKLFAINIFKKTINK